jgi:methionyl-tRNA synthetase
MRAQLGLPAVRVGIGLDIWPVEMPSVRAGLALAPAGPLFPTYDEKAQRELLERLVPKLDVSASASAPATATAEPPKADGGATSIAYDDFAKIDLRVGLVKTCERVPKKDKLLKLSVDLGEPAPRTIVAGLALTFAPEDLVGRRVIVVANLAPRDFGKALISHGMLLASGPSEKLVLATIDGSAEPGARLK